tara:strand:+ start:53383 stop:54606 length:1224 start_codon:yes stop_codon:yes gene_type:complete
MFYKREHQRRFLALEQRGKIIALVFITSILAQLGIDLYLPSMPSMALAFHTSLSNVQLSLTVYMLGYGGSQLLFGYLVDKYGRRPVLLLDYAIFLIATIGLLHSPSIYWLLGWRFCQGLGAAAGQVTLRTMLRDLYDGKALAKVLSMTAAIWAVIPIVAPVIGGYVQHYLNWQANFQILLVISALGFILTWKFLPETKPANAVHHHILHSLRFHLKNKIFMLFSLAALCSTAMMMAYGTASPAILLQHFNITPVYFGWLMLIIASGNIAGALLNTQLLRLTSINRISAISFAILIISVVAYFLTSHLFSQSLTLILLPILLLSFSEGMLYPNLCTQTFNQIHQYTGIATALFGTIMMLGIVVASAIIALAPGHALHVLAWVLLAYTILLLLLFLSTLFKTHEKPTDR